MKCAASPGGTPTSSYCPTRARCQRRRGRITARRACRRSPRSCQSLDWLGKTTLARRRLLRGSHAIL
jgi:hypothetical protein